MSYRKKMGLLLSAMSFFIFANMSFAVERVEKLAQYNAFEMLVDVIQGSTTVFKGQPILVNLEKDVHNLPKLTTTRLINNYSEVESKSFSMHQFLSEDTEYELDVEANDDAIYALLTNNDDNVRIKKNVLLRSTDGYHWELYKSFPAEWELFNLEVSDSNLSVACVNCEDILKVSYIISHNNGKSWNKYSLSENTNSSLFSGIANDKLFVVAQNRNPDDRKELINELMFTDLKSPKTNWRKSDISSISSMSVQKDDKELVFKFDDVTGLFAAGKYLIASVTYSSIAAEDEESIEMKTHWISRDNGMTWHDFKLKNLDDEEVMQLSLHGDKFHIVTNKQASFPEGNDEEAGGLDILGLIMQYLNDQKYSYYSLSQDEIDNTSSFELNPRFELYNGLGFNINYKNSHKASFVDTMFLHNDDDDLKLEFYRLHNK